MSAGESCGFGDSTPPASTSISGEEARSPPSWRPGVRGGGGDDSIAAALLTIFSMLSSDIVLCVISLSNDRDDLSLCCVESSVCVCVCDESVISG